MPTNQRRGQETSSQTGASPFSGAASHNAEGSHGLRYPGDLQYHGGPVVEYATQHTVLMNPTSACPSPSCWGDPIGFLSDLGRSDMIHVTDQYVGAHQDNRYIGDTSYYYYFPGNYMPSAGAGKPFTDQDLANAAYLAAETAKSIGDGDFGLNHIYHLFLTPGQDVCFDNTFTQCYSPDNPNTFYFCAYHNFTDIAGNVVLYTVEPHQNVPGCSVRPNTPNGQLVDSTNDVLSHETFETITDPDGETGWRNQLDNGLYHQEIGDECSFLAFTDAGQFEGFDPSVVRLNHKTYAIQPEYDNSQHACAMKPEKPD